MSSSSSNFTTVSFGGSAPQYWFNPATSGVVEVLTIGTGTHRWKLEIDPLDGSKLKLYYSSDGGVTYAPKLAIDNA